MSKPKHSSDPTIWGVNVKRGHKFPANRKPEPTEAEIRRAAATFLALLLLVCRKLD